MTRASGALFRTDSLCSRMRQTLRGEQKLRGLFGELAETITPIRHDESLGLRPPVAYPLLARAFLASRPEPLLAWREPPALTVDPTGRLEFRARLSVPEKSACRAYLFDALTLARLWHAYRCRALWYEAARFEGRPPSYDHAQQLLAIPPATPTPQLLLRLPPGQLRSAVPLAEGGLVVLDRSGRLLLVRSGQKPTAETAEKGRAIRLVTAMPDGRRVVSAGSDGVVRVWQSDGTGEVVRISSPQPLMGLVGMPGDRVALVRTSGQTALYDASRGAFLELVPTVQPPDEEPTAMQVELSEGIVLGVDPQGRALLAVDHAAGTDLLRRDLDRSVGLDQAVTRCFGTDHVDGLHSARILSATAELNGSVGPGGVLSLTAELGPLELVPEERELARHLFVVVAVDG